MGTTVAPTNIATNRTILAPRLPLVVARATAGNAAQMPRQLELLVMNSSGSAGACEGISVRLSNVILLAAPDMIIRVQTAHFPVRPLLPPRVAQTRPQAPTAPAAEPPITVVSNAISTTTQSWGGGLVAACHCDMENGYYSGSYADCNSVSSPSAWAASSGNGCSCRLCGVNAEATGSNNVQCKCKSGYET